MLPHHGSDKNFNEEILEFPELERVFVTANEGSTRHPGPIVRRQFRGTMPAEWIITKDENRRIVVNYVAR